MKKIDEHELSSHVQKLPALSSVVTELLSTIDREEVDIDSIARKISCDQVLTVKTLRLANSSFYGMQHKIASIHEAVSILGFKNVRMLIATSAITGSFVPTKLAHFNFTSFWQHAIGTAICAQEIAVVAGSNREFAFITGLIHDIGKLVLVTHYPGEYEMALAYQIQHNCDPEIAEMETLGIDHSHISQVVLNHWKFPEVMQSAVLEMNQTWNGPVSQLAEIVHLGDVFALGLDFGHDPKAVMPKISPLLWNKMKLDEPTCTKIFSTAITKFEEITRILIS